MTHLNISVKLKLKSKSILIYFNFLGLAKKYSEMFKKENHFKKHIFK